MATTSSSMSMSVISSQSKRGGMRSAKMCAPPYRCSSRKRSEGAAKWKIRPRHPKQLYVAAYPFTDDVLNLPVKDIEQAVKWYGDAFGLREIERQKSPYPAVIMAREGIRLGFAINGGDAEQDGAAILVSDIERARDELESKGVKIGNWRVDERDGRRYQVFFVIAPDGLCFYFHQPIEEL